MEKVLVDVGAIRLGDQRLMKRSNESEDTNVGKIRQGNTNAADDDSDWD